MKKIRVAMVADSLNKNGISYVIKNYCTLIDKEKFDVTVIAGLPIDPFFSECFDGTGVKIVEMPERKVNTKLYYKALRHELSGKKYDIVHVHGNSATISVELLLAKLGGIKRRVAHSHNTTCDHIKADKLLRPLFYSLCNGRIACGEEAGRWLFGKREFTVLPNGFDTKKFIFNPKEREKIRSRCNLTDKFVIGCVARFNNQKNHPYLLKIFESVAAEREDACLFLVGDGPNRESVLELIENHPYKDRIVYYGESERIYELYSAMDIFVLPTRHEGLGIVFIEAQISGLPCVTTDVVPRATKLGNSIVYLPLSEDVAPWRDAVLNAPAVDRAGYYGAHRKQIQTYEIKRNVKDLERFYISLVEK